mmetsp:Transcript_11612/g.21477  ORF Transcript_11612/g.21477 Transcript_11612/m.21477 type:complete len:212 (-) Transcript_11612:1702-2337(-)
MSSSLPSSSFQSSFVSLFNAVPTSGLALAFGTAVAATSVSALNCACRRPARIKSFCRAASCIPCCRSSNRLTSSCSLPARIKSPLSAASCIFCRLFSTTSIPLVDVLRLVVLVSGCCSLSSSFVQLVGLVAGGLDSSSTSIMASVLAAAGALFKVLPSDCCGMEALLNSSSSFGNKACSASICKVPVLPLTFLSIPLALFSSALLRLRPNA